MVKKYHLTIYQDLEPDKKNKDSHNEIFRVIVFKKTFFGVEIFSDSQILGFIKNVPLEIAQWIDENIQNPISLGELQIQELKYLSSNKKYLKAYKLKLYITEITGKKRGLSKKQINERKQRNLKT